MQYETESGQNETESGQDETESGTPFRPLYTDADLSDFDPATA